MKHGTFFKKLFSQSIVLLFGLFFTSIVFADNIQTYSIDPNHSYVLWKISHFGFSNPSGKWYVEGNLQLDQQKPENSKVSVTIPINKLDTGIPELDKHLKSPNFLNAAQYPTASFESTKVELTGKNTAKVYGTLTLHGKSKQEILNVNLNKSGDSPITNQPTVGFSATTQLKRSDFDINTLLPGLGDDVTINIELEASKPNSNNSK